MRTRVVARAKREHHRSGQRTTENLQGKGEGGWRSTDEKVQVRFEVNDKHRPSGRSRKLVRSPMRILQIP